MVPLELANSASGMMPSVPSFTRTKSDLLSLTLTESQYLSAHKQSNRSGRRWKSAREPADDRTEQRHNVTMRPSQTVKESRGMLNTYRYNRYQNKPDGGSCTRQSQQTEDRT